MSKLNISGEACTKCGACAAVCPEGVFETVKGRAPRVAQESNCIVCGQCVAICASGAVTHADFPPENVRPIQSDRLPSADQLLEAMRARRSVRVFQPKPLPRAPLEQILEAAQLAPTAHNFQPTEYAVVQNPEMLDQISAITTAFLDNARRQLRNPVIRRLFGLVAPNELRAAYPMLSCFDRVVSEAANGVDIVLRGAPCLILFHADPGVTFANENTQLALENATLMAAALGLGSFYTGFVVGACARDRRIPKLLEIPPGHRVFAGLALGYPFYSYRNWVSRKSVTARWI